MKRLFGGATAFACGILLTAPAFAISGQPDLRVWGLVDPPTQLAAGQAFSTEVWVRNVGRSASHNEGRTTLFLSHDTHPFTRDIVLGDVALPRIAAGHTSEKGTQLRLPAAAPPGSYFLVACTDAGNKVRERDEHNNCFGSAIDMQVVSG